MMYLKKYICYTDDVHRGSVEAKITVDGAEIYCLCMNTNIMNISKCDPKNLTNQSIYQLLSFPHNVLFPNAWAM